MRINRTARDSLINRLRFRAEHYPASRRVFCNENEERIKGVKLSFATACRRAGITDFRVHDARHTCAPWLVTAGVPLSEVSDLLGHSTVTGHGAVRAPRTGEREVCGRAVRSVTFWSQ